MQKNLAVTGRFKDHFSTQSAGYAKYRPGYPASLFEYLASEAPALRCAWDCATGTGQAAVALTQHFERIIATDASAAQIAKANAASGIAYRVATAEHSGIADASVDLITVGQALHWFKLCEFLTEASRVLRDDGVLTVWCYELCHVNPDSDAIVDRLYRGSIADFWPPERSRIEAAYAGVQLPGVALDVPTFAMQSRWSVDDMLGYLRTWSACNRYMAKFQRDPVDDIEADLRAAWGSELRNVTWPLTVKASRLNSLLD